MMDDLPDWVLPKSQNVGACILARTSARIFSIASGERSGETYGRTRDQVREKKLAGFSTM